MGRSDQTTIGRAGEYLVAHIFELAGVEAYRIDGDCDLVLNIEGALVRLEVKAASAASRNRSLYRFYVTNLNADVFAFVALDLGLMRLRLPEELPAAGNVCFGPARFTHDNQATDIERIVEKFGGQGKT